jgi:acyl-CoA dehydrogenase
LSAQRTSFSPRFFSALPKDEGEELRESMRESVRKLCSEFPGKYWADLDDKKKYPAEFVQAMIESGYLSILVPEKYGGAGLGIYEACAVLEEVQKCGCNSGAIHAQMYTMGSVLYHGSEEQKKKWLPQIASGDLRLQAFGVSEPNNGTDTLSLETTATYDAANKSYIVNGQKMWTSRAEYSDLMVLLARTATREDAGNNSLSVFLVDMNEAKAKGQLTITPVETMMNHSTTAVFIENLVIPEENLIGKLNGGLKVILSSMNAERILIASECIGDARYFIDKATNYANERHVFGRPIGQNQGVQFPIARAYANVSAASLMVDKSAKMFDQGLNCGAEANMAKLLAADASWEAANVALQTHGGFGFAKEYHIERKFRETRLYQVAPISTNLILSFLAEKVLKLPRSY